MAAKTALYILGGFLLIPGLFQFYNASQLRDLPDSIYLSSLLVEQIIDQKIQFGIILTISGSILILIGYLIKPSKEKNEGDVS